MPSSDEQIRSAAAALEAGGGVVYPTETVYGLGVDATSDTGLCALLELKKGRLAGAGISLLVENLEVSRILVAGALPEGALRLAERFWPGPLTLVLPASERVAPELRGPTGGVGLRCSPDPSALRLIAALGRPITSTSANPTGEPPARTVEEAEAYFGTSVAAYIDGGPRTGTSVSSVVEFLGGSARLLRAGEIPLRELQGVIDLGTGSN